MKQKVLFAIRNCFCLILFCLSGGELFAQEMEEALVRQTLENYMSGERERVEKAFELSAHMQFVDIKTGEFKKMPITEYIGRLGPAGTPATGDAWQRKKSQVLTSQAMQRMLKLRSTQGR